MSAVLDPAEWPEAPSWPARARRLGPLRYSDLGPMRPVAPEPAGPLAEWLVAVSDSWWKEAGRPDPFTLVVVASDDGQLARRVLELGPECLPALRYVLVQPPGGPGPSEAARHLALEEPAFLFPVRAARGNGEQVEEDWDFDEPRSSAPPARGVGPLVTALRDLPVLSDAEHGGVPAAGAYVAVGVLSRLPADRYRWSGQGWEEARLAAGSGPEMYEIAVPAPVAPGPDGVGPGLYSVPVGAEAWLRRALRAAPPGWLAVVDRWSPGWEPVPTDGGPQLTVDQLRRVAEPEPDRPVPVAGSLSAVTWRVR